MKKEKVSEEENLIRFCIANAIEGLQRIRHEHKDLSAKEVALLSDGKSISSFYNIAALSKRQTPFMREQFKDLLRWSYDVHCWCRYDRSADEEDNISADLDAEVEKIMEDNKDLFL